MLETEASGEHLYHQVAHHVEGLIASGTLRAGDRIPSVRALSRQLQVSVSTVLEAYRQLEDRHLIEARPRSGYYARPVAQVPRLPDKTASGSAATSYDADELVLRILRELGRPELFPLGAAVPSPDFFPTARLSRMLSRVARRRAADCQRYAPVGGFEELRQQVARRLLAASVSVSPDELVITSGAQQAVDLCLRVTTKPGDTVLVETPTYYALLQVIEALGLRALEIATDPADGICLAAVRAAIAKRRIGACVLIPSFGNPLGHSMPEDNRRALAKLLAEAGIPLIEDDVYGELSFEQHRSPAVKAFDRSGMVLHCSSVSKTLAPGFRIGWAVPGKWLGDVARLQFASSVVPSSPAQLAVAELMKSGGFEHHLKQLRRSYAELIDRTIEAVGRYFPEGTRSTRPRGGHVLWVELPSRVDTLALHTQAVARGVSVFPGFLFSPSGRYRNFVRLNCATPWSPRFESALRTLGELALGMS